MSANSFFKQPGWDHVFAAFVAGAREARANPEADETVFGLAADAYTKLIFSEVDPETHRRIGENDWPEAAPPPSAPEPSEEPPSDLVDRCAQRIASWEDGCVWPDSWDANDVAQMRLEAKRVLLEARAWWSSHAAPAPSAPAYGIIATHKQMEYQYGEPRGTFACPICRQDTPHQHSADEIASHRKHDAGWQERRAKEWQAVEDRVVRLAALYPERTPLYLAPPPSAPQPEAAVAVVTECEACFTPDVCQLRGKCDYYSAEWLRVAPPPPAAAPSEDKRARLLALLQEWQEQPPNPDADLPPDIAERVAMRLPEIFEGEPVPVEVTDAMVDAARETLYSLRDGECPVTDAEMRAALVAASRAKP